MSIDLRLGKVKSAMFPFGFYNDDKAEWAEYSKQFPEVVATALETPEERFKGVSADVFAKAVEYIPRSLMNRPYQYWMAHRLIGLLNEENKSRVLDYGCGAGNMGMIFAFAGFKVDFAEVEGVITDFLKWRTERRFLQSPVFTHQDNLSKNEYDLVCMQNVMEHLDNPLDVLEKLTKAIAPRGYFLITCNTSGKGLDVVTQETIDTVLMPFLLENFTIVENTDKMLFRKN